MFRSLIIFALTFLLVVFGLEYLMPPFGTIVYLNPVEIVGSITYSIAYVTGMSVKLSMSLAIASISIIPLIVVIEVNRICKKKKKRRF
ncbi:hypothetical protein [Fusobacterium ulcerans]|uniref:Uncharacterized protein n=1 Tax=Fusobacterium ulcerans 12-1B TaxID=457404 RepID=H1PT98_9FUSO|nr:hypothetical protein [Fusobacterium ulcerans]EHO81275.1 hypothetical protein HMPREF0402_01641 [Fusobacterium ulcerans 12-1B]